MSVRILIGDARERLKELPDESVHCVVTSPPYWGLRDYGVVGQIGLETSPTEFVDQMLAVFAEVRRVLRSDGTLWLNLGDSYAGSGRGGNPTEATSTLEGGQGSQLASIVKRARRVDEVGATSRRAAVTNFGRRATRGSQLPAGLHEAARLDGAIGRAWVPPPAGLKQKDLVGMPWMVAFALRGAGWWLRQDIIWSKPNPMPESIGDRCTKAHEYLFLLSKSERYFYDANAIKEPASYDPENTKFPDGWDTGEGGHGSFHRQGREKGRASGNKSHKGVAEYERSNSEEHRTKAGLLDISSTAYAKRNKRSVWTVATSPFSEAHFATFPPALVEPCILAGCPEGGTVLDPFGGAGTTALVADRLGRDSILIELNPDYAAMAERRIRNDAGMMADVRCEVAAQETLSFGAPA